MSHKSDEDAFVQGGANNIEVKAHGISDLEFDALFDVVDRVGHVLDGVRYNNLLLDTNWIDAAAGQHPCSSSASVGSLSFDVDALSKRSRSPGNAISLVERLRSLGLLERKNGDQWSGQTR